MHIHLDENPVRYVACKSSPSMPYVSLETVAKCSNLDMTATRKWVRVNKVRGPRMPPRRVRCRSRDLAVPDRTQQDFRQAPDGRPRRPRHPDRQDSPSCPASTIFTDVASISFSGSPPRLGPVAGLHQSGSWGRQTPG